jgi:hypothetical protein
LTGRDLTACGELVVGYGVLRGQRKRQSQPQTEDAKKVGKSAKTRKRIGKTVKIFTISQKFIFQTIFTKEWRAATKTGCDRGCRLGRNRWEFWG